MKTMKKMFLINLSLLLLLPCLIFYSYAEIVIVESNNIQYELDLDLIRDWYVDKSTSFADCYWVLFDNKVDRGSAADTNSDGTINGIDCIWILQYIAGWDLSDHKFEIHGAEFSLGAADTNGDGKVNLYDVSLLMKYVVGWFDRGLTGTGPDYIGFDQWIDLKKANDKNGIQTPGYMEWLALMRKS